MLFLKPAKWGERPGCSRLSVSSIALMALLSSPGLVRSTLLCMLRVAAKGALKTPVNWRGFLLLSLWSSLNYFGKVLQVLPLRHLPEEGLYRL